ncbi:MAG: DUF2207 domain-containing protein [Patescibacteria group bacterium]
MGGESRRVNGESVVGGLFKSVGLYKRSLGIYLLIFVALLVLFQMRSLRADDPVESFGYTGNPESTVYYDLASDGNVYLGKTRAGAEIFKGDTTYRFRLQVVDTPTEFISELNFVVRLPFNGTEDTVGYRMINNGGADTAQASLYDARTLLFTATNISPQSQLAIEFEVPQAFISRSAIFQLRERLTQLPPALWAGVSIALPALAALILLITTLARNRRVGSIRQVIEQPPSRLAPALVGILLRGRLTNREVAATLLDLARRGHLVIRHLSSDDFRFRRQDGVDKLEDFEQALLDQIFGTSNNQTSAEEINFSLAQEVFSKRVSQSFILAYKKIGDLGFFNTNPLRLHLRYQIAGLLMFLLGVAGFFVNLFLISGAQLFLFFWLGMIISALLVFWFSRGIPARTIYGDRELAKWLGFSNYLTSKEPINYAAHSQEKYLAYLPYAVVFEVESEWTRRFYDLPFFQPDWYIAANINTVDQFANKIFPLFGYLSHVLTVTTQPASR